jgi:replicative DNA helicase
MNAEAAVISAVLLDPAALPRVIDFLHPEHMFSEAHRRIIEASVGVYRKGDPVDAQTVASWLHAQNRLVQVGGIPYITEILDSSPAVANVRAHAVAVHDMWRRRQLIEACDRIAANGRIAVGDVQSWCEDAIRALAKIGAQNPVRPVESNDQALARMLAEAFDVATPDPASASGSVVTGFPTGIHGLDEILGGCHKGAKTTIAATTGAGKTTIAMQIAVRWAKRGIGVLFMSTEMKREALLMRAVCAETGIPMDRVKKRQLSAADRAAMTKAAAMLAALPLRIDQTAKITIDEIIGIAKTEAERMPIVDRVPLGAVMIDYVQRLEPPRHIAHKEKKDWVAYSTKHFKLMCQELDVAGIELAQAKPIERGVTKRTAPNASNGIAESAAIAHEADNVVFLVNESEATPHDPRQNITAHVAKQRDGRKGPVSLYLYGGTYTFVDPNTPDPMASPSRQYADPRPEPDPPQGRFDDYEDGGGLP